MSVLRISGTDRFLDLSHRAFTDEMVVRLGALSPLLAQTLGDARLRAMIHLGIARAHDHGFGLRGPVRLYLELMVLLGSSFDRDPQYPWAAEILAEYAADPMRCAQRLHVHAMDYLEELDGPDDAYLIGALSKLGAAARGGPTDLSPLPASLSEDRFIPEMLRVITEVHPVRAAYIGRAGLEALIRRGILDARFHGVATPRGTALLIALMSTLGHGCAEDPQYPWIAETLSEPGLSESDQDALDQDGPEMSEPEQDGPERRVRLLERRSLDWLERVERFREEELRP